MGGLDLIIFYDILTWAHDIHDPGIPDARWQEPVSGVAGDTRRRRSSSNPSEGLRFEMGNLGDHKLIGKGVWEARLPFGPGYRVYFAKEGSSIILLLLGGDKASQGKDIRRAQQLWAEYRKES